jgi:Protein of unknown function (DUF1822)
MNQPTFIPEYPDWLDWHSLGDASTELLPEQIHRAAQLSSSIITPEQRWQVYLSALGVLGFEQWLGERAPDLQVRVNESSIWQSAYANILAAACNIQVGPFKVCVITANKIGDLQNIPFAVFDVPNLAAHFYVFMQVEEELQQVGVYGFMSYQQFHSLKRKTSLQVDEDLTYTVPENEFNLDADALLLNLRCLDASAIELPVSIPPTQTDTSTALQQKLTKLQSDLKKHPSQFLTVKEATTLLSNPNLINWLYALTRAEVVTNPQTPPPLIKVTLWLRNQIDTVASELGWMLMPTLSPSPIRELRKSEDFQIIRDGLEAKKIYIPSTAQGASRDLNSDGVGIRLYAVIWELDEVPNTQEWMMLIALGPISGVPIPKTLKLEVRDQTQELFNQSLEDTTTAMLYARVIGDANDRFWVTVTADESIVFEIPAFSMGE